jgi:hypothetical protein
MFQVVLAASIIALMLYAESTSKTSVNIYQITWRNSPEGSNLQTWCHENLKSHKLNYINFLKNCSS